MNVRFADRMENVNASITRETMKLAEIPGMINFGGGMPYEGLFPVDNIKKAVDKVFEEEGRQSLQYSTTEGYLPLRNKIVKLMAGEGVDCDADDILILSGSQQGLEFSGKIFINPGDVIVCEKPSYVAGLNAYRTYQANFLEIESDDDGMIIEDLIKKLEKTPKAKYIYIIPNFQNPTGKTWSVERRKKIIEVAEHFNIPIVEDNPYGDLIYEGEKLPAVKAFDKNGIVIYLGTFSKTICPSFRVGWVVAAPDILLRYNQIKQSADLQTSTFNQRIISRYLDLFDNCAHIQVLINEYKAKRDTMVEAIKREFPDDVKYTVPTGGMFIWVELPENMDAVMLRNRGIENNVAILSGETFYPQTQKNNTFRMSFTAVNEDEINIGIKKLGDIIKEMKVEGNVE